MKRFLLTFVALLALASTAFAFDAVIERLTARPEGENIRLEWRSGNEAGVQSYIIERSDARMNDYEELGTITATGNNSFYSYTDNRIAGSIMPNNQMGGAMKPMADLFKYRLKLVYTNAISYSQTVSVTKPSAGVRRTWGMIKEMFH